MPAMPMRVLKGLSRKATLVLIKSCTLSNPMNLDLALFHSSPLELVALSTLNAKFSQALCSYPEVVLPVRRYTDCITTLYKTLFITIAL